jgi:hypothetical protein
MEKITKREMFVAIKETFETGSCKFDAATVKAFCDKEIASLDAKAAKAKERAATKKAEGDELTEAVRAAMSAEEFEPIADIAARIEGEDITVAKVQYRLTQLVKNGEAEKEQITVPGGEGQKARKIMAYKLIG